MSALTATAGTAASSGPSPRAFLSTAACACAGAAVFLFAVDPNHHAVYPQCPLYQATGIYCAGCGATRAVYALLHGRMLDALHDNVLLVAGLPLLLYVSLPYLVTAWRENAWPAVVVEQRPLLRRAVALFLLMMAFMLLRNLPGEPFDLLRPLAAGA